jgi:hypothetical protein
MSHPLTAEAAERRRNLLFLTTPQLWPVYPFLPLVRRRGGAEYECGLLYDLFGLSGRTGFSATVLLTNLFAVPATEAELLALPKEVYDSAEEVFNAGWRVD